MNNHILLARPHPFIKDRMKPLLESCGFRITQIASPGSLDQLAAPPDGAVVSLAVASDVRETASEVATALRSRWPELPLLFAALLPAERARLSLERLAAALGFDQCTMVTPDGGRSLPPGRSCPSTFLYINHHHLADDARQPTVKQMLTRHFC